MPLSDAAALTSLAGLITAEMKKVYPEVSENVTALANMERTATAIATAITQWIAANGTGAVFLTACETTVSTKVVLTALETAALKPVPVIGSPSGPWSIAGTPASPIPLGSLVPSSGLGEGTGKGTLITSTGIGNVV